MKILLDENCQNLKPHLVEMGWKAVAVKDVIEKIEGNNGVSDDQVLSYAMDNKHIIITKDKGLKKRCKVFKVPFIDLGSPEQDAIVVDEKLKKIQALKEYLK